MASPTDLSIACRDDDFAFVENYISSLPAEEVFGAVNRGDPYYFGDTHLIIAAQYGGHKIVSFLLEKGARKDFTNDRGVTAHAQTKNKYDIFVVILAEV